MLSRARHEPQSERTSGVETPAAVNAREQEPDSRGDSLTRRLCVDLAAMLRRHGVHAGPAQVQAFYEALHAVDELSTVMVFLTGRMTLAPDVALREPYARAFAEYFFADLAEALPIDAPPRLPSLTIPEQGPQPASDVLASEQVVELPPEARVVASDTERLIEKSFKAMTPDEVTESGRLIKRLRLRLPSRLARRRTASHQGEFLDMRRTLRRSLSTDGEPVSPGRRTRKREERPVTLVLDVSGSMSSYTTPMLRFAHVLVQATRGAEAYTAGVRLHRITEALRARSTDRALAAVTAQQRDWEGGTLLASSLRELLNERRGHAALRGAVVVIVSDGLDRDDPADLSRVMSRLAGLAHRVIWLNPLKGDPRYQPLQRGMAAALPFVDVLLSGHNIASLVQTAQAIEQSRQLPQRSRPVRQLAGASR